MGPSQTRSLRVIHRARGSDSYLAPIFISKFWYSKTPHLRGKAMLRCIVCLLTATAVSLGAVPQREAPTRAEVLRGEYGPYRANNDLLYYHLDIRVDPGKKFISGKNTIRFKMLQDA